MAGKKYVYNESTLTFEEYKTPGKFRILTLFGYLCATMVTAFLFFFLHNTYFPSQKELTLMRELDQMKYQYTTINDQLEDMSGQLAAVQERDRGIHRFMLGMDPIDENVWSGGTGGSDKYAGLIKYPNTGEVLIRTKEKVDKLMLQLKIQKNSLDTITEKAHNREEMLASIPSIKPVRIDLLNKNLNALSGYGIRLHPVYKVDRMHTGLDFTAPIGTPIQATGDGVVVTADHEGIGYGNHIIIDHGFGYSSLYGHMSSYIVKVGDTIHKGQTIGYVGNTGTSTGPHLHYEVRVKGNPVDPIIYCMDDLTPEEYQILVQRAQIENQSFD
ncbi:MAG TPA: peptidoglycan DD-metalloendopeptidase family protein [Saprospiraceae bacterium]|nr:peptidoglycan DD-metalloendopeptidase family protein [Saprospiraceae bacterium]